MPTSATGSKNASLPYRLREGRLAKRAGVGSAKASNGFTLVELMVVIAILAVVTATVMFAIPDPRGRLIAEAEKFAARAHAARDDAILQSRDMRVRVTSAGYSVERRRQGQWQALTDKPFAPARWSSGTGADAGQIDFDATGGAVPATIILTREGERVGVTVSGNGAIRVGA